MQQTLLYIWRLTFYTQSRGKREHGADNGAGGIAGRTAEQQRENRGRMQCRMLLQGHGAGRERLAGKGLAYVATTCCLANAFMHLLGRSFVLGDDVISADLRQAPAPQ